MKTTSFTVQMPDPMLHALRDLARQRDVTVGQIMRDALAQELRRSTRLSKTPARADETLLAPLRALLASDMAVARTWHDLQNRLKSKGCALREAGGGLALHSHPDGTRLCKASELGASYATLMRRFNAPFPGHAHRALARRVMASARDRPDDVIEPF